MRAQKDITLCMCVWVCSRREVQALGLTVLVDARRCSPVPALFKAFTVLQVRMQPCSRPLGGNAVSGCPFLLISPNYKFRM